jgi:hypothetical protein
VIGPSRKSRIDAVGHSRPARAEQVVRPCPQCIQTAETCGAPRRASIEVSGTSVPVFSPYPLATSLNRRNVSM